MNRIGIRREDKSPWEARTPLVPADVQHLIADHGLEFTIQNASNRAFPAEEYRGAGAALADDLRDCPIIMGVKEIPPDQFETGKTYVFFSHTIKGQRKNLPMLRRLMELRCNLIDYEKIVDPQGRRLVFFGRYAGLAGMIDTLRVLGLRLQLEGIATPFMKVRPAHQYRNWPHAREELRGIAEEIRREGIPQPSRPLVFGFAGYGKVSGGAQEVFDLLPFEQISPDTLPALPPVGDRCYKVVFREEDMVQPCDPATSFDVQDYYRHPERYRPTFIQHVPYLTVLINGIYWEPRFPKLIDREQFRNLYSGATPPRLRVIGDISCDLDGSLACTTRYMTPDNPVYVYHPTSGETLDGVSGSGPVVLAIDFLPCELPVDASVEFSKALTPLIPALAQANFSAPLEASGLPLELAGATILLQGKLTDKYKYLSDYLLDH